MLSVQMFPEFEIISVVEKQLGNDKIGARFNLLFQVSPVNVLALLASNMAFGKAGDADTEIALFANECHQLVGELETTGRWAEFATAGRVAAQGQHVPDAESANLVQELANLFPGRTNTGQVGHRREPVLALDPLDNA